MSKNSGAPPGQESFPYQKPRKRPSSFARKITLRQVWRMLWTLLLIDLLLVGVWAGGLLQDGEAQARTYLQEVTIDDDPLPETGVEALTASWEYGARTGLRFPYFWESEARMPEGTLRSLEIERQGLSSLTRNLTLQGSVHYLITLPIMGEGERFIQLRYDITAPCRQLVAVLRVLLIAEGILLFLALFGIHRSVKRTLAPIQQLTAAAYTYSGPPPTPVKEHKPQQSREKGEQGQRKGQELELSGAINTLNTITAKRLDTRINIADERTELQGLAGAINDMLDRLDAAYQSQLRFVSDASHELRTPIAVIQGYANLLDRWGKDNPEALEESISAIKGEAQNMKELVEQLLFLARSDNNSIALDLKALDLSALVEEVLRDTQVIDDAHTFQAEIAPGLLTLGDAGLLKQALRIFVDNAIKYTPSGESIRVRAGREGGQVKVSVTDNGIGIPEEDLPLVFDRFYRSDESRARKTGGTGLGLAIAKWTIQRHGGDVEILSRKDLGTRVTMLLPAAQEATASA